jgi:hypothetical protein
MSALTFAPHRVSASRLSHWPANSTAFSTSSTSVQRRSGDPKSSGPRWRCGLRGEAAVWAADGGGRRMGIHPCGGGSKGAWGQQFIVPMRRAWEQQSSRAALLRGARRVHAGSACMRGGALRARPSAPAAHLGGCASLLESVAEANTPHAARPLPPASSTPLRAPAACIDRAASARAPRTLRRSHGPAPPHGPPSPPPSSARA